MLNKWQDIIGTVPPIYRWLVFAIATAQILLFPSAYYSLIPPLYLVIGVGIYTLLKTLPLLHQYKRRTIAFSLLGVDLMVCILIVISTAGLYSPFLLYTLTPVLTSALFLERRITFGIAALSGAYVIGTHLANPFFPTQLFLPELSYFLVYIIATSLAAALPYLINVNLRQRLQSEDILRERQRLSREIHDGTAQTLSALRWQAQLLHRRLMAMGIELDEVKQLEMLAEKARQDTRASLELLRSCTSDGSFLPNLKSYLEKLSQESHLHFRLEAENGEPPMEAPIELELLYIFQEALANVRKHSGARNVEVKVESVDNHLEMKIADDGCGFDALAYYQGGEQAKGHGLRVMQERAESIGGRLRVLSMPGQGTEVQVEVPASPRPRRWLWQKR
jgi:signal transduction histidine kinase